MTPGRDRFGRPAARLSRRRLLAGSAGAALFLAACGGDEDEGQGSPQGAATSAPAGTSQAQATQETPRPGGTYRIATTGALGVLDPHNRLAHVGQYTGAFVFTFLLRASALAADKGAVWDLATAFENPDGTTWTFKLRPDVVVARNKYGIPERPLDAEDVKANFERIADPANGAYGLRWTRGYVERFEAPDKQTFRVVTKSPYAWVLTNLGDHLASAIAPREWLSNANIKTDAVSAGPFTYRQFQDGAGAVLEKNPTYYVRGQPYLDSVEEKMFSDIVAWRTAFISNQVDEYSASNADEAKEIQGQRKDAVLSQDPGFSYQAFWMNTRVAPFTDPRVRRAMALAINRQEYIQLIGRGAGTPIGPITSSMKPYALPQDELARLQPFNPQEARQLFQAAGVREVEFTHPTSGVTGDYVNILIRQLQAVGVTGKPEPLEPIAWNQSLMQNRPTASQATPPEFADPDFALNPYTTGGPLKSNRYDPGLSDPEIDAAQKKAAGTMDEQERVKAYHEAQRLILRKDPPWLPYYAPVTNNLRAGYVRGVPTGLGVMSTAFAKDFWLAK
jgi:ABC-type transport system substrate-binding protein